MNIHLKDLMKFKAFLCSFFVFLVIIFGCSPDEPEIALVPDRDRTEQQMTDNAIILEYLETHYYNSGELNSLVNAEVSDIVIDTLESTLPTNHTLLIDAVEIRTTTFEATEYEYYILKINQGGGEFSPNFSDNIRVGYEGRLVPNFDDENENNDEDTVFDSRVITDLNLLNQITGWQRVFPEFNVALDFTLGSNVDYNNYGTGVMFLPSGLSFFSSAQIGIPSYSNLIFKFSMFQAEEEDHDNDGIPSYIEDLNNNLSTFDEDTDGDSIVNYVDPDDDGDGVLTRNELERTEYNINVGDPDPTFNVNEFELSRTQENGVITITTGTIVDTDSNNVPDYLDVDITTDYSEDN